MAVWFEVKEKTWAEGEVLEIREHRSRITAKLQVGSLQLTISDLEKDRERLEAAISAVRELSDFFLEPEVQSLRRIRIELRIQLYFSPVYMSQSPIEGYVNSEKNLIRISDPAKRIIVHEVLHLVHPGKPEWFIEKEVKKRLRCKTFAEVFLENHVFACTPEDASEKVRYSVFEKVYVVPVKELERLKKKRRGATKAVTEAGEVIYLSKKDRERYWGFFLHQILDYFDEKRRKLLEARAVKAMTQALYSTYSP